MERNKIHKKELLRFLVGGGSAVITDYIIYQIGMRVFHLDQPLAKGLSFLCGSAVGLLSTNYGHLKARGFRKRRFFVMRYCMPVRLSLMPW